MNHYAEDKGENMKINLLDSNLGIQNILDFNTEAELPKARSLASSALKEAGLEDLYAPQNYAQVIEEALCPQTGDGDMLRPEIFSKNLSACAEKMQASTDKTVLDALHSDLLPLAENKELLQAYSGLMIGG